MTAEIKSKIISMTQSYFAHHPYSSHIGILQMCLEAFPGEDEKEIDYIVKDEYRKIKSE